MVKILIADDDEIIRKLLGKCMEMWGYELAGVARNLPEGLAEAEAAKEKGVQVAIVDGNLGSGAPGTSDGASIADALRKYAPEVRIIAHTGQAERNYGDIYIQKPFNSKDMKSAIEKALAMGSKI